MTKSTKQKWSHPCELLLRARLVPDRTGVDTQVVAHIPLSQLRQMPGAGDLEDAWMRARVGEDGYLTGKDAEAAACDAQTVPVVTGTVDPDVIDQMIGLARTAAGTATAPDAADGQPAGEVTGQPGARTTIPGPASPGPDGSEQGDSRSSALSSEAWRALRYALAPPKPEAPTANRSCTATRPRHRGLRDISDRHRASARLGYSRRAAEANTGGGWRPERPGHRLPP